MMFNVTHKTPEIILALDVDNREEAEKILQATGNKLEWVKVGLQSYLRDGPDLVRTIADSGKQVFLDLKLHDIPNTMAKAMESLSTLPIGMLTLHAHAGEEALKRCAQTGKDILPETLLLAVTVLTSMDQDALNSIGVQSPVIEQVERLARVSTQSEIGGIVCSPHELVHLRACLPSKTKMVTPGIRPAGSAVGDQKRIMTPAQAKLAGADYLVIGRPILAAENPANALDAILEEMQS
jgi:orotidine-5'-phosphate decarboxylase